MADGDAKRAQQEGASHANAAAEDAAEAPFRQFFELAPDAVIIAELAGPIVLVNGQVERAFGYRRDELMGAEIEKLLPQRYRTHHPALRANYARQPHLRPMGIGLELYGARKDGSEFPVEISLGPVVLEGKECVIAVIRDVTEQKRLAQQTREAFNRMLMMAEERRKLLQFTLDELPGGVYLTCGPDARLVLANYAAEAVWGARWPIGAPMGEFLKATGVQILSQDGRQLPLAELATVRAARSGEAIRHQQEIIRRPDGLTHPVLLNAVALDSRLLNWEYINLDASLPVPLSGVATTGGSTDASGGGAPQSAPTYASLVVLQDISAVKEAERLKDEFITLAAHELKTPIAAVRGYAELLARDLRGASEAPEAEEQAEERADDQADAATDAKSDAGADAWRQEALAVIDDATQRLVELVDDLLDVTRLQANRLELRLEPHDLVALARRVIRRAQATTTRHTISLHAEQEHIVVTLDQGRIEQVVSNLLGNAIKYSPEGGEIIVALRTTAPAPAADEEQQGSLAELQVRDSGIGIPREQQGRIFGRFARANNAAAQGIGGVGLGLYLCRALVERHHGRIWFESSEGQGATFFVTLPFVQEVDA